jgi:carbamoyl-phosphate synthase small subunit
MTMWVEGLELSERGAFSVQYHPEAAAGPHDAAYLFDRFVQVMEKYPRKVATH